MTITKLRSLMEEVTGDSVITEEKDRLVDIGSQAMEMFGKLVFGHGFGGSWPKYKWRDGSVLDTRVVSLQAECLPSEGTQIVTVNYTVEFAKGTRKKPPVTSKYVYVTNKGASVEKNARWFADDFYSSLRRLA